MSQTRFKSTVLVKLLTLEYIQDIWEKEWSRTSYEKQLRRCYAPRLWENQKLKHSHISSLWIRIPAQKSQVLEFQRLYLRLDVPRMMQFRLQWNKYTNYKFNQLHIWIIIIIRFKWVFGNFTCKWLGYWRRMVERMVMSEHVVSMETFMYPVI